VEGLAGILKYSQSWLPGFVEFSQEIRVMTPYEEILFSIPSGDLERCRKALANGVSPNATPENSKEKDSLLHNAAAHGQLSIVQLLLEKGATPNALNARGETPLHHASALGHDSVVRALIQNRASMDVRDQEGRLPVDYARNERVVRAFAALRPISPDLADWRSARSSSPVAPPAPRASGPRIS